jgi:hypothetical protein
MTPMIGGRRISRSPIGTHNRMRLGTGPQHLKPIAAALGDATLVATRMVMGNARGNAGFCHLAAVKYVWYPDSLRV